jgi:phosphoglucomutase/phosphomannomutase
VYRVFQRAGFAGIEIFEPQRQPDGNFTNVPDQLPNPERRAVFEPAIARAKAAGAGLVLASDPDADRLGAAVAGSDGRFQHLTGNQIGALLADYVLRKRAAAGSLSPEHYVVETIVTTPLVARIAAAHGVRAIGDLLIGFKYIAETMDGEGAEKFVFGAEESLGYLAGTYARDKDAAVAGLYLAELAAELGADGKTLLDRLDELYREHGYYLEGQTSESCPGSTGQQQIQGLMRAFREAPPVELAGCKLERVRDYAQHEVRNLPTNRKIAELPQPNGNLLFFDSGESEFQVSVAVRPSGTEPKIKFYYFLRSGPVGGGALDATKRRGDAALKAVMQAFTAWVKVKLAAGN